MKKVRLPVALAVVILASAVVWRVVHTHNVRHGSSFRSEQRTASPPTTPTNYRQPSPLPTAAPAGGHPALTEQDETEQRLGPFQITGQNYFVVLRKKHLPQNRDVPAVDGVVSMEIVDAAGTVLNQRTFPLWAEEDLHTSWSVFAGPLIGSNSRGLIVKYGANVDESAEPYLRRPAGTTFVQLYADPDENSGPPKRIAVKPTSKINLLIAAANLELKQLNSATAPFGANDPMKDQLRVQVVPSTEVWLRVDVDGNQGWLQSNEDLDAIGLREAEGD